MKTTGRVNGIISNIVIVKADGPVGQNEICYVWTGDTKMMAEVIKVIGDAAYVQVFDSTRGLKIGDRVEFAVRSPIRSTTMPSGNFRRWPRPATRSRRRRGWAR